MTVQLRRLGDEEWKVEAKAGRVTAGEEGVACLKAAPAAVLNATKEMDSGPVAVRISTSSVDRHNDTVSVEGWRVESYLKNPVVLFAHESWRHPHAKSLQLTKRENALVAEAEFMPRGVDPTGLADLTQWQVRNGFLNTASVGFRPLKYAWSEEREGYAADFLEQELLEWSFVPVPANPECLVEAKSAGYGLGVQALAAWCEEVLEGALLKGLWQPNVNMRKRLEEAWKQGQQRRFFLLQGWEGGEPTELEKRLGAPVVTLPKGALLTEVTEVGAKLLNPAGSLEVEEGANPRKNGMPTPEFELAPPEAMPAEQLPEEEQGNNSGYKYSKGQRVSCTREGMAGQGEVVEVTSGNCYAVRMDGEEQPRMWLMEGELVEAPPEDSKALVEWAKRLVVATFAGR